MKACFIEHRWLTDLVSGLAVGPDGGKVVLDVLLWAARWWELSALAYTITPHLNDAPLTRSTAAYLLEAPDLRGLQRLRRHLPAPPLLQITIAPA